MAFIQLNFYSQVLDVSSSVNIILPEINKKAPVKDNAYPPRVLYLLHGYSNDHSNWMRKTSIERYAEEHGIAVIMPAVNHSFYCNEVHGERYWDYISEELPRTMQRFFHISDRPEDTFVAGLSMGGYGAMRLALTYPERFAAAASFSGAVDIAGLGTGPQQERTRERIFGDKNGYDEWTDNLFLMKKNADAPKKPRLYVSCGTDDFLYGMHRSFVPLLIENGWDVTRYDEPGASHEWSFWDREVQKFICFIDEKA